MRQDKFYISAAGMFLGLLLFMSGCTENTVKIEKAVKSDPNSVLALIKTTGQTESYRLKTFSQRKVSVEGPARENTMNFGGGQTTDKIEIVFDSEVLSVEENGNAIEKITIKELKYFAEVRDEAVVDFDSSKDKDPNNALLALIDHSYTIESTPSGQVVNLTNTDDILSEIERIPTNYETALNLVSESNIKLRHSMPLPDANDNELQEGKTWSSMKSFDFGLMGNSSFKRIYKLENIIKSQDVLKAEITMSAEPSMSGAPGSGDTSVAMPMTDVRQTYTGTMELDVTRGSLLKYQETLVNEWLVVPPGTGRDGPPNVLNMTAIRSYDIEKIK